MLNPTYAVYLKMAIFGICVLFFSFNVFAEEENHKMSPDKSHTLDRSFLVSVESALAADKKNYKIHLVDVRSARDYETFQIPGSINIPLYALKTKTFLKNTSVILVNNGFSYLSLHKECLKLKKLGFKDVRILMGGLNAWRAKKQPMNGDLFAMGTVNRVSPDLLLKEQKNKGLLVVNISNEALLDEQAAILETVHIPYHEDDRLFPEKMQSVIDNTTPPPLSILIVDSTGENYEGLEKKLKGHPYKGYLFFLSGGIRGYDKFLQDQARLSKSGKQKKRSTSKCPFCK